MWKKPLTGFVFLLVITSGCNTADETRQEDQQNIYESVTDDREQGVQQDYRPRHGAPNLFKQEEEEEMKNAEHEKTNRGHDNDFYNEQSLAITREVNEMKEVVMTQAIATENRVMVAVMLDPYSRRDRSVKRLIRERVDAMTDVEEIYVYTNYSKWDEMKNLNARVRAAQAPEKVKEEINQFLKRFQPE
ncbi:YhcN/YlaJ family sporulation lipoprotein [Thalassobacillus pellis]|uniref:YhcN/YlaJ family sporulation lipoprotein n=1 Tax=Thalassobacillus pellis TaxID=748008 RepID=UPI001961F991|nr:YhcN/YlaJ family sporulation lipoprotein [Thalassobacillus pellis]MBM7554635.1 hypothetical protein [Thalassobacillus pellis]